MKIERFFMSYNPDNAIDFETLERKINSKMEFKRRKWEDELVPLTAKCIATAEAWRKFNDYLEGIEEIGQFNFEDANRYMVLKIKHESLEQDEIEAQQELRRIHREMAGQPLADEPEEKDPDIVCIECPEEGEDEI
ncbi:hypothetical protein BpHYR1_039664 [Brachionus plicatilis]|uniref:Uncharacterized protein n=1 Tax=Brachionus plicatilis TaxID=10195 RepID=A0A3M7RRV0_BRAPC|nr:hypothetical protein BpHYR1_039664 [Brachionus plicatilis]